MKVLDIFKGDEEQEVEEFTELPFDIEPGVNTHVVIEKLGDFIDADRIARQARSGNVVIAEIKTLKDRSPEELKHAISKMKTSTQMFSGDIAGVGEEWLIVTPKHVRIDRGK